jgi:cell division protein ZapE
MALKIRRNNMPTTDTAVMTPSQRYQRDLASGALAKDSAQAMAIGHFQRLYDELVAPAPTTGSVFARLMSRFQAAEPARAKGLYVYGGVGRGKTYLMDVFFESLPFERKMRTHFHRFMQRVHAELNQLKMQKNPLELVARKIAAEARVICFDEFFVSDIGDAMILGGLLTQLIEEGVTFVTTSNIEPDSLYANGLQRERFLPAIALLKQHTTVFRLDGGVDYRLRSLKQAKIYYSPLGADADAELLNSFSRLADHGEVVSAATVEVLGREIPTRMSAEDIIWFECEDLCGGPRSAYDYIELAKLYQTIVLSNVPLFDGSNDDLARRFVNLVDEFYDRHVKLILSAQVPLLALYQGTGLAFVFERTVSRLLEMQSEEYLGREHRP